MTRLNVALAFMPAPPGSCRASFFLLRPLIRLRLHRPFSPRSIFLAPFPVKTCYPIPGEPQIPPKGYSLVESCARKSALYPCPFGR